MRAPNLNCYDTGVFSIKIFSQGTQENCKTCSVVLLLNYNGETIFSDVEQVMENLEKNGIGPGDSMTVNSGRTWSQKT